MCPLKQRETDAYFCSGVEDRVNFQLALVQRNDSFCERQSHAMPLLVLCIFGPVEWLENMGNIFPGNTNSVILEMDGTILIMN